MALEYTNRKGDVYYLHEGRTCTGKPKYYCSRKRGDAPLDAVPEGYDIYESPEAGFVNVRKIKPSLITSFERAMVEDGIRRYAGLEHFIVDVQHNSLVVYLPSAQEDALDWMTERFDVSLRRVQEVREDLLRRSNYVKMMRFVLVDEDKREFHVDRWCFLGSIDTWFPLAGGCGSLRTVVEKYVQHLGKKSFFELM